MAQLPYLVDASEVGQLGVELSGGDGFCFLCQASQGIQFTGDDTDEEVEHHQQTNGNNGIHRMTQTVEAAEDVAFRTDDSYGAPCSSEGLVENVATLAIDVCMHHAVLAPLHGVAESGQGCIGLLEGLREDGLTRNLGRVGMHEVCAAAAYHDAVGIGIRLQRRDGLREPTQREAGIDDAYHLSLSVLDDVAIAGHHIAGVGGDVEVHVGFRPGGFAQQHRHEVPVHVEVLVVVAAALYGADGVALVLGIS